MELKNKTVAVTGASGMIGVYICRSLLKAGARVRGVVRNPDKAGFLRDEGVTFAKADLLDRDSLTDAFRGADAIVSNAALYSITNHRWEANYKANKEGTENVFDAAAEAGVKRIVHISTFGVYKLRPYKAIKEEDPQLDGTRRQGGSYRATKQLSEALAWKLAGEHELDLTVLRPTGVYGARDNNLIRPLAPLMRLPVLPALTGAFPLVYAGDVADAVVGALRNDASAGKAYNTGGADRSIGEFFVAWKEAAGKGPWLLPFPVPLRFRIDNSRAETELGFRNRPFVEGLREVFAEDPV